MHLYSLLLVSCLSALCAFCQSPAPILCGLTQPSRFLPRSTSFLRPFASSASHTHGLTHVDSTGTRPSMVDVSEKKVTTREAEAQSYVLLPTNVASLFETGKHDWNTPKGPVIVTAIIAGTNAVKQTSNMIPFCHPLPVEKCKFHIEFVDRPHPLGQHALHISCTVRCTAKTGVEMEALTGASVAALTVYDMLKAISHDLVISDTKLVKKSGGKSDYKLPSPPQ